MITPIIAMAPPSGGDASGSLMTTVIMFGLIFVIFYFMIIRPQQKRAKERQAMLDSVKKGDRVITSGGMHGKVINIDDGTILVEVADNVKIKFERSAITAVIRES